jgi:hypothetical protein
MNNFYTGVVEDRHDPLAMGRVRVRVFGVHSDDRVNDVPIDSLPWSMVMLPANASSTSGGISQLVEGTWVLIMYIDQNMQDPLVIGSLPSTIGSQAPDYSKGFTDPFGVYPKWSDGTADTSLAAKPDTYTEHPVYTERARTKIPSVPVAKRYKVSTVAEDEAESTYERGEWGELDLRGNHASVYPYNAVTEYEGGMLEEFDSTPGNQRVTRTHPSGTYEEILVDGTKTVKIVGTGFEIVLKDKSMYIKGDLNMTVDGSMNHFVKGDYTLEVGGNFYQTVGGSTQTKIIGNAVKEVGQDVSINIGADYYINTGAGYNVSVGKDKAEIIAGDSYRQIVGKYTSSVAGNEARTVTGNYSKSVFLNSMEITNGFHNIETFGPIKIDSLSLINLNSTAGLVSLTAGSISSVSKTSISQVATTSVSSTAGTSISQTAAMSISNKTLGTISLTSGLEASLNSGTNVSINSLGVASVEAVGLVDVLGAFVTVKGPAGIALNPPV